MWGGRTKVRKIAKLFKKMIEFYAMKEALIYWYELCHESNSYRWLIQWIQQAKVLNIPELAEALKTFEN